MLVLITYDVNTESAQGKKRLRQIAKQCVNFGQRVQHSVFECVVDPAQFEQLKTTLMKIADVNSDSLRFYILGNNWKDKIFHYGAKKSYNPEDDVFIV